MAVRSTGTRSASSVSQPTSSFAQTGNNFHGKITNPGGSIAGVAIMLDVNGVINTIVVSGSDGTWSKTITGLVNGDIVSFEVLPARKSTVIGSLNNPITPSTGTFAVGTTAGTVVFTPTNKTAGSTAIFIPNDVADANKLTVDSSGRVVVGLTNAAVGTIAGIYRETAVDGSSVESPLSFSVTSLSSIPAPFYDNFLVTGAVAGRSGVNSTVSDKWTETNTQTGGSIVAVVVSAAGHLSNQASGTYTNQAYAVVTPAQTTRKSVSRVIDVTSIASSSVDQYSYTTALNRILFSMTGPSSGQLGSIIRQPSVNGTVGSNKNINRLSVSPGDTVKHLYDDSSGSLVLKTYHNGKLVDTLDVGALGVVKTGAFGFVGSPVGNSVTEFEIADPDTMGTLTIFCPRRTAVKDFTTGAVVLKLRGEYTMGAPSGLIYTAYDMTSGSPVAITGHVDQPIQTYAAANGAWSGKTKSIISTGITSFFVRVARADLINAQRAYARTPNMKPGFVGSGYGQSLDTLMNEQTTGATVAYNPDLWSVDNSLVSYPLLTDRRITVAPANQPRTLLASIISSGLGNCGVTMVLGGHGGTRLVERLPASPNNPGGTTFDRNVYTSLLEGIDMAGGDISHIFDFSGQYDVIYNGVTYNGSIVNDVASFASNFDLLMDSIDAYVGHAVKVILAPVGHIGNPASGVLNATTQALIETMRYTQWKMVQNNPTRYALGPYTMDLQPTASDQYHLTDVAFGEQARRLGQQLLAAMGVAGADRTGPKLFSVALTSTTGADVTLDLNGATALELVNTAANGTPDYLGGLQFATDSAFTAMVVPTGATINTAASGKQSVSYTFPAIAAGAKLYVRGPYGGTPFNPTFVQAVANAMTTKSSMLRGTYPSDVGTYPGGTGIPVQPFYQMSGVNYIVSP